MEMTRAQTEVRRVALDPHREAAQALVEVVMVVPVAHVRREMESAQPGFPVRKVTAPTATDQLVNKGIVLTAVAHKGIAPSVPVIAHTAVALKETDLLVRKATAHMAAALKVIAHSVPVTVPMATDLLVPRVTAHMAAVHKVIVQLVHKVIVQLVRKATAHTAAALKATAHSVLVTGHTVAAHREIVLTAVAHKVNVSRARAIGIASARGSKTPPRSRCLQVGVELPAAALARSN